MYTTLETYSILICIYYTVSIFDDHFDTFVLIKIYEGLKGENIQIINIKMSEYMYVSSQPTASF